MPSSDSRRQAARAGGTVLARVVSHILAAAANEGMDRDTLIAAAGLEAFRLDDPEARLPLWTEVALWQLLAKAAPEPGLGIRIGASLRVREMGLLGYAFYFSPTLAAALRRLERYGRLITEAVQLTLEAGDPAHVAIAQSHPALGAGLPLAVDARLATLLGACREVTRTEIVPAEVAFTYEQPATTLAHRRFFGCPLRFGRPRSMILFEDRDVQLRIPQGDERLAGYLSRYAETVLDRLVSGAAVTNRVRSAIWADLSEGPPSLASIAREIGMAERTLQRRLAAEGTSLQLEVDRVRQSMALAVLRDREIPIEEVAFVLGYTEPSTFYRAFKRWTGQTPRRYRAEAS